MTTDLRHDAAARRPVSFLEEAGGNFYRLHYSMLDNITIAFESTYAGSCVYFFLQNILII